MLLNIALGDKTSRTVNVDSATTAEELCQQIALGINLKDTFGFSVFITLYDKVNQETLRFSPREELKIFGYFR